jgi:alkanesulfonate monooxygenase SsuD/methylene tetrahydromethanopterin reductase-like flavin-dependent oxidoreductase (luciferase family)
MKGIIGGGAAAGGAADRVMTAWRDALARVGRETELGTDLAIGYTFHIAETEQKAIKEATPFFEENMKMFAPLGFVRGLTPEQIEAIADPRRARSAGLPTLAQAVAAGAWLCGPPERIIEKIQDIQDRYPGLEAINVGSVIGTPKKIILEQLEIFAKEVMPAFKHQVKPHALAD